MTSEINVLYTTKIDGNLRSTVLIPKGTIVLWSGKTIPDGWVLCDGDNNTPNLSDKFVKGGFLKNSSRTPSTDQTGGRKTYQLTLNNLPSHSHGLSQCSITNSGEHKHDATSAENGNHKHGIGRGYSLNSCDVDGGGSASPDIWQQFQYSNTSTNGSHTHTFITSADGTHKHNCTIKSSSNSDAIDNKTGSIGGNAIIDNQPQFYVLAYIMKI